MLKIPTTWVKAQLERREHKLTHLSPPWQEKLRPWLPRHPAVLLSELSLHGLGVNLCACWRKTLRDSENQPRMAWWASSSLPLHLAACQFRSSRDAQLSSNLSSVPKAQSIPEVTLGDPVLTLPWSYHSQTLIFKVPCLFFAINLTLARAAVRTLNHWPIFPSPSIHVSKSPPGDFVDVLLPFNGWNISPALSDSTHVAWGRNHSQVTTTDSIKTFAAGFDILRFSKQPSRGLVMG